MKIIIAFIIGIAFCTNIDLFIEDYQNKKLNKRKIIQYLACSLSFIWFLTTLI